MIKIKSIDELKIGQNIYGFYQSIFKEKKISKNGDYYIDLLLKDRTGQINGKIWHFTNFYDSAFQEGDLVAVKGEVKKYRKTLFLEINNISLLNPERYAAYGFDSTAICPSIDASSDMIFTKIKKQIVSLDEPYKTLLLNIYDTYEYKIKNYPDYLFLSDYNKKGSLILKIYRALSLTKSFHKKYIKNNSNIILSAILLKYIGRVNQYNYNLIFSFSDLGHSEDCFILSRDIIKKFSKKINNFPQKIINELIDIVMYKYDPQSTSDRKSKRALVSIIYELEQSLFLNDSIK